MNKEKSTAEVEQPSTAIVTSLDPQALITEALKNNANVDTLERLFALAKDLRKIQAREAWLRAMAAFQQKCPPILRSRTAQISTRAGGRYSYSYAPLAEILGKVQPVMGPLGLSVAFRVRHEKDQVGAVCIVSHEAGHHEESGEVIMPIETATEGGTGANPAQRVGIASTYAKRYALVAIIGIAPEEDPDAKPENGKPTDGQAPASGGARNVWIGKVLNVKSKTGKSGKGNEYTIYTIQTGDAQEFETFSKTDADFAKLAGSSRVQIVWESDKYGKKALSIEPAPGQTAAPVESDPRG